MLYALSFLIVGLLMYVVKLQRDVKLLHTWLLLHDRRMERFGDRLTAVELPGKRKGA